MSHGAVDLVAALLFLGVLVIQLRMHWSTRRALEEQLDRLERQNEIGRVLLTDRNMRGVTRHVAESAARLLGSDLAHVTLVTEHEKRLVVEAATGALAASVGAAVPREGSMAGWVIARALPIVVNDPDSRTWRGLNEHIPLRRSVMLPLIARGRCVGALGVDNPRDGRPFGPAEVALLRDLADYAALAIEAIKAIEELAARERHAALLNRINSRIRQSLDLQQILDTAVREMGAALEASRCYVRLRRGSDLQPVAAEWAKPGVEPLHGQDPAGALVMQAYQYRRTTETFDARQLTAVSGSGQALQAPLAVLATPLILRGDVIGVVAFHHEGVPRLWRAGEISLIEESAEELAIAVSNARLYRTVEDASRELSSKISELERANRMKAQFLANMSHELRTPLNSVIGFSELLLAGDHVGMTPEQHDALETISRNGRHLLGLVNDVLDLSKVDAGRMDLNLQRVDMKRLVPGVVEEMDTLLRAKDIHLEVALPKAVLEVHADEQRARQVLTNLLSNAIKFTPPSGAIRVSASRRRAMLPGTDARLTEREAVWLAVTDTGIGIAAEDVPRLFSEFSQVDQSLARRYEGTGLGLALCKRFMDLHGGRIGVESAAGRGSTFWVEFPVEGPLTADR